MNVVCGQALELLQAAAVARERSAQEQPSADAQPGPGARTRVASTRVASSSYCRLPILLRLYGITMGKVCYSTGLFEGQTMLDDPRK